LKILLDLDGVLTDFVGGAIAAHGIADPYADGDNHGVWDFSEICDIPPSVFWERLDYEFWANLRWTVDGGAILSFLEAKFGYQNICLLTSPPHSNTGDAIRGKIDWVERHLPKYKRQLLIGPAKEFCAHSGSILVDDADHNVTKFALAGGNTYLVPRVWNSKHAITDAVKDLQECL
jgi:hypothetical protein